MSDIVAIKDRIVETMLAEVAQRGWSWDGAVEAAQKAGFQDTMCKAVFPEGLNDVVAHFSDIVDRRMIERLKKVSPDSLRVRDRVMTAMVNRFELLESMNARRVVKATLSYWALPVRVLQGQRVLWRSADRIWNWAGDTAQDYNKYTKRGLLSSIIMGTTLVWIDDKSEGFEATKAFLERRIENVMEIGKAIGTIRPVMPDITMRSWTRRK